MPEGCTVCAAWHRANPGRAGDCGHWCHFAGAEDWDGEPDAE